jgi:hypothetical protein
MDSAERSNLGLFTPIFDPKKVGFDFRFADLFRQTQEFLDPFGEVFSLEGAGKAGDCRAQATAHPSLTDRRILTTDYCFSFAGDEGALVYPRGGTSEFRASVPLGLGKESSPPCRTALSPAVTPAGLHPFSSASLVA